MRISPAILTGMLLALTAGSATQAHQEPAANPGKPAGNASQATAATPTPASDADYKIGPQDVLRIDVWKEPDISRVAPVRPDGRISLPLLNDVQAAGLTPTQLAAMLTEGLKKFITNPQVTVSVSEINSRRVYVTGEVTKPGAFPLLPNMTVLQALSSSGGFSQFAKSQKHLRIARRRWQASEASVQLQGRRVGQEARVEHRASAWRRDRGPVK